MSEDRGSKTKQELDEELRALDRQMARLAGALETVGAWDYGMIQALAASEGRKPSDFYVLADGADPFSIGKRGHERDAKWFKQIWDEHGFTKGVHLRRIHYRLIGATRADGSVYENTERCWSALCDASAYARYIGLVPYGAIEDHRNPDPAIYTVDRLGKPQVVVFKDLELYEKEPSLPSYAIIHWEGDQPYHVEVWCEKTTQNDILIPWCEEHKVNLVTGMGELSITAAHACYKRIVNRGKPAVILYVSDFDPTGWKMPINIARKLEFFLAQETRERGGERPEVRLRRAALTPEQVARYALLRMPIKPSDPNREKFEKLHGVGATELDALEVARPGELKKLMDAAIAPYYDATLDRRAGQFWLEAREALSAVADPIVERYRSQIEDAWATLVRLHDEVVRELEQAQPEDALPAIPEGKVDAPADDGSALFDSGRDYRNQLERYRQDTHGEHIHAQNES